MKFLKRLFGKKEQPTPREFSQEELEQHYELKKKGLEDLLNNMHDMVGHAIIPFELGGAVDMYYFPNHIEGTAFATMELLDPDGNGPMKNRLGTYELIAFTRHKLNLDGDNPTPFNKAERDACSYLSMIGKYSSMAVLNPNETIEIPNGESGENTYFIFDKYPPNGNKFMIGDKEHHLLLCLRVFKSEWAYAKKNGSDALFNLLEEKGIYPYGDLDRDPIV
jgi:hypothetical protein